MEKSTKQQRCYFIELIAYWEGGVNTTRLDQQFSQSRQQSSGDINYYKTLVPHNLEYDASQKIHKLTHHFSLGFISSLVSYRSFFTKKSKSPF
jgi:hypothetical protein